MFTETFFLLYHLSEFPKYILKFKFMTEEVVKLERKQLNKVILLFFLRLHCSLEVAMGWPAWGNLNLYGTTSFLKFILLLSLLVGWVSSAWVFCIFPCRLLLLAFQSFCDCVGDIEMGKVKLLFNMLLNQESVWLLEHYTDLLPTSYEKCEKKQWIFLHS